MKNKSNNKTVLVIFGITGDLSSRKLLPAISKLKNKKALPKNFEVVGVTRQKDVRKEDVLKKESSQRELFPMLNIHTMDLNNLSEYETLKNYLRSNNIIFYLSVAPEVAINIIDLLGKAGFGNEKNTKILLEKPFGVNLSSAKLLIKKIEKYFDEHQVYRIDHYLAKETVQNLITFRHGNSLFKKTWNNKFIERIEIFASESIGIEGRAAFYEKTGALRDIIQSHLLQLTALTLMDLPKNNNLKEIPKKRLEALKKIININPSKTLRAQYKGYKKEAKNEASEVETFVRTTLFSKDPKWKNVPIVISTGKKFKEKFTEIKIYYKQSEADEENILKLKIQPDEGIEFSIWAKEPGYEKKLIRHSLKFNFKDHYQDFPEAYEQVLYSAIKGDQALFTSSNEVLESWRIISPLQKSWKKGSKDLIFYKPGVNIKDLI